MDVDEDYDEVFEFWIPGVCLSGKISVQKKPYHPDIPENVL